MPEVITKSQSQILQTSQPKIAVLIVAAGRGSRAGAGLPKQYRTVAGKMILSHTLDAMRTALPNVPIKVVVHRDDLELYHAAAKGFDLLEQALGGATRQESVRDGLAAMAHIAPDYVLVHDAARPFIDRDTIERLVSALERGAMAVLPAIPVTDTLKAVSDEVITRTVKRDGLYSVQTPQAFRFHALLEAHERATGDQYTDDGAVMEANDTQVRIVEGNDNNFKITTAADLTKAEQMLMMRLADIRTGSGYDVHRFEEGDHVWLCGVRLPFTKRLKGHSDADVGLHALTDAILAALAEGDIGQHFPPSDDQWRGSPSDIFLSFAKDRVLAKGGVIAHVAICLICERPKIGPHNIAMRARIAELLQIDIRRVSVQATTTEKLGFTGREEGIAAQATATVRLPFGEN
ncbi:bifunctional 2-C-methyl-D-erythritol 4-phosphate cytidylyltransferase/2-C-methyl-D-erythritol 2,4-cyclodiphosphate synthase [Kordiimonas aestuarii]|uniref:bifunctional 2-C-methyl-D-erythritol 4-phosphate cytidylyltransferase/2-C-methyl-D-erythritol 2,4-cyclodiphosphate synthase n=1 Tax=Kordiimonas aestuarii TaxID=1005925 RepID=UPI0021D36E7C|nr:bifunctional 2-C-methyl-D-erythritol 4-phosphate cytidylyltransferase/2-C-methyl-D-erythritol 2,4-cyclodiphosphate synthase [Kordiimonas aestuarii]